MEYPIVNQHTLNRHYLDLAEQNIPPMFYEVVTSDDAVTIESAADAFLGCRAVPCGKAPEVLMPGDKFTVDFGRHCVGRISFTLADNGRYLDAPVRIRMRLGETPYELYRDHATYHGELCPSWLDEEYFNLDEIGRIELPRRYSFRYMEITVVATPRPTRLFDFAVKCETSADVTKLKSLPEGTDPELVAIDRVGCNTLRDCMHAVYEDAPRRDRRLWQGDLRIQALVDQLLFDNRMLARRCFYLFAACTRADKYLPGCLYQRPEVAFDDTMEIPDFTYLYCVSIAEYYNHTGDLDTLRELFPVIENEMRLAIESLDENNILTIPDYGWPGFIDWAAGMENVTGVQGVFLYALKRLIPMARVLGKDALAAKWEQVLVDCTAAARKHLYNAKKGAFINKYDHNCYSVQAQIWMILGGVIDGDAAKKALTDALASPDKAIQPVTPYMHFYLLEAMMAIGMKEEAVAHIKNYWGGMVREGADTYWEVYDPARPDLSAYGDPLMHSFCHAFSIAPTYFIRKYLI